MGLTETKREFNTIMRSMRYKMFGNLEIELREKFNFLKWIFPISKKARVSNLNNGEVQYLLQKQEG